MTPKIASTGKRFGTIASSPKRQDRNTRKMTAKTVRNAVAKLLICETTR